MPLFGFEPGTGIGRDTTDKSKRSFKYKYIDRSVTLQSYQWTPMSVFQNNEKRAVGGKMT